MFFFFFTAQIQSAPMKQSVILASGCCYTSNFRELAETTMGAVYSMLPSLELERKKKAFSQSKLYMSLGRSGHLQVIFIFLITFPLFFIFPVSFLVVPIQKVIVKYQNSENVQSTRRPSKLYIFFPCALPARGSGEHSSIRLNVMFIEELLDDSQPSDLFLRIL